MKIRTLMSALAAVAVTASIAIGGIYNFPFASLTANVANQTAATLPMTGIECIAADTYLSGGRAPQTACYTQGNIKGAYVVTMTDGATITPDVSGNANLYKVTLAGNRTMATPTGIVTGQKFDMEIIQDSTGSRTITWSGDYQWPAGAGGGAGTAPTLTTTASRADIIQFWYTGTKIQGLGANSQNRAP